MAADITPTATPDFVTTLSQARSAFLGQIKERPSPETVVKALLQAETTAKQQKLKYPLESLLGEWRLCFVTGTRKLKQRGGIVLGKGFYLPKFTETYISFTAPLQEGEQPYGRGEIANKVQLNPLVLKLTGPMQYQDKKNLLAFDFTHMHISLFGRTVYNGGVRGGQAKAEDFYNQPIAKLPFFAFFLVTEDVIAARGRGGGLALWIKIEDGR
jgi:hypothetical protein